MSRVPLSTFHATPRPLDLDSPNPRPQLASSPASPASPASLDTHRLAVSSLRHKVPSERPCSIRVPPQVVRSYWPLVGAGGNHQALCSKLPGNSVSTSHPTSATRVACSSSALSFRDFVQLSQRLGKQAASTPHSRRTAHLLDPGRSRSGAVSRG